MEHKLTDWRFRFRGELSSPVEVLYVDMDSKSISDLGNQPWDRAYYAEVCSALLTHGKVKAIGLDYVFSEKGQPELADATRLRAGNRKLAEFLYAEPPVVLAASYVSAEDRDINGLPLVRELPKANTPPEEAQLPELPEFRTSANLVWNPPTVGLIDTINNGTRFVPLFARVGERTYLHLSVELARLYWKVPRENVHVETERIVLTDTAGAELCAIPLREGRDLEVNWFSRWISEHNPRASFSDVLTYSRMLSSAEAEEREAAEQFFEQCTDAVVLIGPVDPFLQDLAATPMDLIPVPRVGIHGNLLKTIVSGVHLKRLSHTGDAALAFGFAVLVCLLALAGGKFGGVWRALALVIMIGYVAAAFWIFATGHWVLPIAGPIGAAFTTSFAGLFWQVLSGERDKRRIKSMFGAYVSPQLVNRLVDSGEDPKLGGADVEITAYFSDIQSFSIFSERLQPAQLVELMNEYLTACSDVVVEQGGTLDKYIGDAVVVMFGAPVALPDHAFRACIASQLVQQRLAELRQKWAREGDRWPALISKMHTRIGLNTGMAVVGNIGSYTRFNYTMMGDTVNLAARMETGARAYGANTLVTEVTKAAAEKRGDRCVFRFLDRILVKGRSQPVEIYEITGLKETLPKSTHDCLGLFAEGMGRYLQQDWDRAIEFFRRAAVFEPLQPEDGAETNPSLVYLERCELMKQHPPGADWDGIFVMRTK